MSYRVGFLGWTSIYNTSYICGLKALLVSAQIWLVYIFGLSEKNNDNERELLSGTMLIAYIFLYEDTTDVAVIEMNYFRVLLPIGVHST